MHIGLVHLPSPTPSTLSLFYVLFKLLMIVFYG